MLRAIILGLVFTIAYSITTEGILHYRCYQVITQWKSLREHPIKNTIECVKIAKQLGADK